MPELRSILDNPLRYSGENEMAVANHFLNVRFLPEFLQMPARMPMVMLTVAMGH